MVIRIGDWNWGSVLEIKDCGLRYGFGDRIMGFGIGIRVGD